jgi:lysophospholipase L1-like esterase
VHPLHAAYDGAQVDAAVRAVAEHPGIELVTLQLGGNDVLLCSLSGACGSAEGVTAMADEVRRNVGTALGTLRGEGGYDGPIVVVSYYAPDYSVPSAVAVIEALNSALAEAAAAHGAVVADAFGTFAQPALAAAGSTIAAGLVWPNDTHPTARGHRLLADAVKQVL